MPPFHPVTSGTAPEISRASSFVCVCVCDIYVVYGYCAIVARARMCVFVCVKTSAASKRIAAFPDAISHALSRTRRQREQIRQGAERRGGGRGERREGKDATSPNMHALFHGGVSFYVRGVRETKVVTTA